MKNPSERDEADRAADTPAEIDRNERLNLIINKMIHARDPAIIKDTYQEWASDYDEDLQSYGYVAPEIGSRLLQAKLPSHDCLILDAGCGTGLVGACLAELGYQRLQGTDFSEAMLEKASARGVYASVCVSDFTSNIASEDGIYDGVISIGVYKDIFRDVLIPEMLRVCKAGGVVVFSARPVVTELARDELLALQSQHKALSFSSELQSYMKGQNADATYFIVTKGT